MRVAPLLAGILILGGGCVRDEAEALCPTLSDGDLVITEIGGPQTGNDLLKPWIEVYNASGASVDMYGMKVRFRRRDGSSEIDILVRRALPVAAGAYTVLGLDDDANLESYIDYGFQGDFAAADADWLSGAAVDLEACGALIDRAVYDSLPRTGTFSLGSMPPTGVANDLPINWCTDATLNAESFPGSPQRANIACP